MSLTRKPKYNAAARFARVEVDTHAARLEALTKTQKRLAYVPAVVGTAMYAVAATIASPVVYFLDGLYDLGRAFGSENQGFSNKMKEAGKALLHTVFAFAMGPYAVLSTIGSVFNAMVLNMTTLFKGKQAAAAVEAVAPAVDAVAEVANDAAAEVAPAVVAAVAPVAAAVAEKAPAADVKSCRQRVFFCCPTKQAKKATEEAVLAQEAANDAANDAAPAAEGDAEQQQVAAPASPLRM